MSTINQFERIPPHDIEAEICTLGSLMLCGTDANFFSEIRSLISSDSFFSTDHSIIYGTIDRMQKAGEKVDFVTLRAALKAAAIFDDVGGHDIFEKIATSLPSWTSGPRYARIVKETSSLRRLIAMSNDVLRRCYAPRGENHSAEIASEFSKLAGEISVNGSDDNTVRLGDLLLDVAMRTKEPMANRMRTGLDKFDEVAGGLGIGRMTLIGGRPGMGKSALIKQIVLNAATQGVRSAIISIEESGSKIGENVLSNLSGIENHRIAFGVSSENEWKAVERAASAGSALPIFIDDASYKLASIEASVIRMATKYECKLIAIDYLQLIDGGQSENENREITLISKGLKMLIKRLNIASLIACQLNRGGDSREIRKPTLKDLRGSGSLEQDGDLIVLVHREDYYRQHEQNFSADNQLEAIIAKNKDGSQCLVPLHFNGKFQRITNWNAGIGVDPNGPERAAYDPSDDLP